MKIRNGFVSNSSSASFVIENAHQNVYQSVFDLAKTMIAVRDDGWWRIDSTEKETLDKLEKEGCHPNNPVSFNTVNYRTYIFEERNKFYIHTCSNHDFPSYIDGITRYTDYPDFLWSHISYIFLEVSTDIFVAKPAVIYSYPLCNNPEHYGAIKINDVITCKGCFREGLRS